MLGVMQASADENDAIDVKSHDVEFSNAGNDKRFVIRSQRKSAVFSFIAPIKSSLMCTKRFSRPLVRAST
jgi:hypothetical protein